MLCCVGVWSVGSKTCQAHANLQKISGLGKPENRSVMPDGEMPSLSVFCYSLPSVTYKHYTTHWIGMSPNPEFPPNHVADIVPENHLPSKQPPCPPATWALANTYLTLHCMWKKAHCVPVMNTCAGVYLHVVGGKAFPRAFCVLPIHGIMKHFYVVL